jgi:ABC-type transport system involved in multi-copper enzyme maturation permease subunit
MRSVVSSLFWKEFHELKWSVLAAIFIALMLPLSCLVRVPDLAWGMLQTTFVVYPFVAGVLFGMRAAAGERSQRTAALLAALPVPPWKLGIVKLISTSIATLVPILLLVPLGVMMLPWADQEATFGWNVILPSLISAICTLHILLIVAAFGAGQPTEVRAAVVGLAVIAVWGITGITLHGILNPTPYILQAHSVAKAFCAIGPPLEWFGVLGHSNNDWFAFAGDWRVLMLPLSVLALTAAFLRRYRLALGLVLNRPRFRWPFGGWMIPRLAFPLIALSWKQFRETLPWSFRVLGIAALLSIAWTIPQVISNQRFAPYSPPFSAIMAGMFAMTATLGGYALALLIGVGTFAPDLEPGVSAFWRSRPISVHQWFWSKFVIGFVALLVTLGVPTLILGEVAMRSLYHRVTPAGPMWVLLGWFGIYSAAVFSTCLIRHVLYSAILAVGLTVASFTLVQFWDEALFAGTRLATPGQDACIWVIAAVGAVVLAWQAAVHDFALRTT